MVANSSNFLPLCYTVPGSCHLSATAGIWEFKFWTRTQIDWNFRWLPSGELVFFFFFFFLNNTGLRGMLRKPRWKLPVLSSFHLQKLIVDKAFPSEIILFFWSLKDAHNLALKMASEVSHLPLPFLEVLCLGAIIINPDHWMFRAKLFSLGHLVLLKT